MRPSFSVLVSALLAALSLQVAMAVPLEVAAGPVVSLVQAQGRLTTVTAAVTSSLWVSIPTRASRVASALRATVGSFPTTPSGTGAGTRRDERPRVSLIVREMHVGVGVSATPTPTPAPESVLLEDEDVKFHPRLGLPGLGYPTMVRSTSTSTSTVILEERSPAPVPSSWCSGCGVGPVILKEDAATNLGEVMVTTATDDGMDLVDHRHLLPSHSALNHTLAIRDADDVDDPILRYPNGQPDKDIRRCPHGQHAKNKEGISLDNFTPNGCGIGFFASILPGSGKFGECCNAHDRCFADCPTDQLHTCNDEFLDCMSKVCETTEGGFLGWLHQVWCWIERDLYDESVRGHTARDHFMDVTRERCYCVEDGTDRPVD
ncbi:uncharacterized protein Z520_04356 [Fonsecaea multimorphosa CBS 102226]|uniref:Phospholipase A2 domain-containing protein n=1 Tax=Fonsecaea multimorphosa CBS 102226 TaxID=1442371 RepID=A0A0D2HCU8_9EURO|nr:uncharacterized protein Z520_04356 [Fonsecaea multimorphosa CBS 102226]KIX99720.1 hypothetical protein Z520_04356 [Fonsecaea multimorphosa CBS 102226]OAL26768.1 hypothetical protein AYO22_04121 [Fonsecaea multimorphosa]